MSFSYLNDHTNIYFVTASFLSMMIKKEGKLINPVK